MNRKNANQPKHNRLKKTVELSSFPKLNPYPISEVDLDGQIYYLNPAARRLFPTVKKRGLDHPWLADWKSVADFFRNCKTQSMLRQVAIDGRYYQQTINYVVGIQRVRIYGMDITERERAEQALQVSETRYRRLFETAQDGILILDAETGQITDVNPFLIEMLGYSQEELQGRKLWECGPFRDMAASKTAFAELQSKGYIRYEDLPLETNDGQRLDVEFVSNVYQVDHKKVIQCNIRDITERKRVEDALHKSEEKYRRLIENVNDLVCEVDAEARYLFVNSRYEQVLGYRPEELLGKQMRDLIHPDDLGLSTPSFKKLVDDQTISRNEWRFKHKNGEWRWFDCIAQTYEKSSGDTRVVVISRDTTERKQIEQALRASKDDLERTIAERTAELQLANTRLRSLTRDIVSTQEEERRRVSRELHDEAGQALTALKLNLENMRDVLPRPGTGQRQDLEEAIALTDKTIDQIRMLAQDLRPPALEAAGLDAALEGLCREFARRTQIQIEYAGVKTPAMTGPATICLYRLLQEALTNAARHGHATKIEVRLDTDAEQVCLMVEDNGQGFDRQAVFSNLVHPKGMGLIGMQERINMVGGSLEIHSQPGHGARLVAYVPMEEA